MIAFRVDPRGGEQTAQAHLDPWRGADAAPLDDVELTAPGAEIGVHHEEPVHALSLRAQESDPLPFWERRQRGVRRTTDEVHGPIAKRTVRGVNREDHLQLDVEPFGLEEPQFNRSHRGKI